MWPKAGRPPVAAMRFTPSAEHATEVNCSPCPVGRALPDQPRPPFVETNTEPPAAANNLLPSAEEATAAHGCAGAATRLHVTPESDEINNGPGEEEVNPVAAAVSLVPSAEDATDTQLVRGAGDWDQDAPALVDRQITPGPEAPPEAASSRDPSAEEATATQGFDGAAGVVQVCAIAPPAPKTTLGTDKTINRRVLKRNRVFIAGS